MTLIRNKIFEVGGSAVADNHPVQAKFIGAIVGPDVR